MDSDLIHVKKKLIILTPNHYNRLLNNEKSYNFEGVERVFYDILTSEKFSVNQKLFQLNELISKMLHRKEQEGIRERKNENIENKGTQTSNMSEHLEKNFLSSTPLKKKYLSFDDLSKTPDDFKMKVEQQKGNLEELFSSTENFSHQNFQTPKKPQTFDDMSFKINTEQHKGNFEEIYSNSENFGQQKFQTPEKLQTSDSEPDLSREFEEFLKSIKHGFGNDIDLRRISQANLSKFDKSHVILEDNETGKTVVAPKPGRYLGNLPKIIARNSDIKKPKKFYRNDVFTSPRKKSSVLEGWKAYEKISLRGRP